MRDLQFADLGVVGLETALPLRLLRDDRGRDGPVLVKLDAKLRAQAVDVDRVVVVVDAARRWTAVIPEERKVPCLQHVVDIAAGVLVPADDAERGAIAERHVDIAFGLAAEIALQDLVALEVVTAAELLGSGLFVMIRTMPASLDAP